MYIGKPARIFLVAWVSSTASGLSYVLTRRAWVAVVVFLVSWPLIDILVDILDHWLRRRTKDGVWVMTQEGKEWLRTEGGQRWQEQSDRS